MDIPVYIHYGATKFIPTKGFPIKNRVGRYAAKRHRHQRDSDREAS